jgi:hypothetical protein
MRSIPRSVNWTFRPCSSVAQSASDDGRDLVGIGAGALARAGDDQRNAGLVDQDGVGLVHDGHVEGAVDEVVGGTGQTVPEHVESDLFGCGVGHVGRIGSPARRGRHSLLDGSDAQAEGLVHEPHPARVPPGEIVVDGEHVDTAPRQGVEGGRQHRRQRLAFTRLHLDERPPGKGRSGDHLHVERTQTEHAMRQLAREGERLREQNVGGLVRRPPAKRGRGPLKVGVRRLPKRRPEATHLGGHATVRVQVMLVGSRFPLPTPLPLLKDHHRQKRACAWQICG